MEVNKVTIDDAEYPSALKKIKDAPKVLYYKGILPTGKELCIAIVGTRRPSQYGQQAALEFSREFSNAGATVVSGLAPGIDTFAHQAVIENKQRTIAVLGTGLDEKSLYPKSNLELSRKIVEHGGCLISELPEGTGGTIYSFPRRNRIVSALSEAVIVIEAKEKSGSLITAQLAIKQQKKLFAVPGSIYSLNSAGPNKLIKQGALLAENANDVLNVLGISGQQRLEITAENEEEQLILNALTEESLGVDAIIKKTNLPASAVSAALALMEISGKIRSLGGNTYSLN
jgi:DNA processing protein